MTCAWEVCLATTPCLENRMCYTRHCHSGQRKIHLFICRWYLSTRSPWLIINTFIVNITALSEILIISVIYLYPIVDVFFPLITITQICYCRLVGTSTSSTWILHHSCNTGTAVLLYYGLCQLFLLESCQHVTNHQFTSYNFR